LTCPTLAGAERTAGKPKWCGELKTRIEEEQHLEHAVGTTASTLCRRGSRSRIVRTRRSDGADPAGRPSSHAWHIAILFRNEIQEKLPVEQKKEELIKVMMTNYKREVSSSVVTMTPALGTLLRDLAKYTHGLDVRL
jgi:hypothetical protein